MTSKQEERIIRAKTETRGCEQKRDVRGFRGLLSERTECLVLRSNRGF